MKKQIYNPFLPSYEYIPDGEPRIFGERLYIYGSHDRFNGIIFCMNDYVCWSAPLDDLSQWRYEGVIYTKKQDPKGRYGICLLFAPDVVKGVDGRYYLYYAIDFMGIMGVAVSDTPAGSYEFYGHIHYSSGELFGRRRGDPFPFDPGVLVDHDGRIYLYSGFAIQVPFIATGMKQLSSSGGVGLELEADMVTIKQAPILLFPKEGNRAYGDHAFFEASSIRKIGNKYYFVYSSCHNHELCYAISDHPLNGFQFGGTLISLGDLYLDGNDIENKGTNYLGNTHGGLVFVHNQWYIFYHRHTNRHSYSRQACAEPLTMTEDGRFIQAELTSCGLNNGPLKGEGYYQARIACNLWSKNGVERYDGLFPRIQLAKHPYFTQEGKERDTLPTQYIANLQDGSVAGYKYFQLEDLDSIVVNIRGKARGEMIIATDMNFKNVLGKISIELKQKKKWTWFEVNCKKLNGIHALYFQFCGKGGIDFKAFQLRRK